MGEEEVKGGGEIENKEHSNKGGFEGRCIVRNLV